MLDNLTLLLIVALFGFFCGFLWFANGIMFKPNRELSYIWMGSNFCIGLGFFAYSKRHIWPDLISYYVADVLILLSLFLVKKGIEKTVGYNGALKARLGFFIFVIVLNLVLRLMDYNYLSTVMRGLYLVYLSVMCSYISFKHVEFKNKLSKIVTIAPIFLIGILMVIRTISLIMYPDAITMSLVSKGSLNSIILILSILSIVGVNITLAGIILVRLVSKIQQLSTEDFLTKTYNRKFLYEHLGIQEKKLLENGINYTIILLDLDKFKKINDTYGHTFGDIVLVSSAKMIKETIGSGIISRLGGEEFAIVLSNISEQMSFDIANKLRENLEQMDFYWQGEKIKVTGSFGFSFANSVHENWNKNLKNADMAMYHAKKCGRNKVVNFNEIRV